ncbi:MAG TPA: hypothetical protein PLO16_12630 [Acidocella sp.]|nr:hypothetical protein [Acidocella sp.]
MTIYAKIYTYQNGTRATVAGIQTKTTQDDASWTAYDVPDVSWLSIVNGQIVAATSAPAAPLSQQAAALIAAGLTITSTSTPAINGTYACNAAAQANFSEIETYILANNALPQTPLPWPVAGGLVAIPSTALFKEIATVVANFVEVCDEVVTANAGTLPAASVAIA